MPTYRTIPPPPATLSLLLGLLLADAAAGRFHKPDEWRVPRNEGAIGERSQRAFGSDYADLGDGCYRHLVSTNSDGESYEGYDQ